MYKQMLFVVALLFASIANAECYIVNGETVCVQSLGSQNFSSPSLLDLFAKQGAEQDRLNSSQIQQSQQIQQQILIQQQVLLQRLTILKNSLAPLSEIDRTTVINEIKMLPKAGQERFLGELVAGTEEQRQEVWEILAHPTEEGRAMRFKFYGQ